MIFEADESCSKNSLDPKFGKLINFEFEFIHGHNVYNNLKLQ